MQLNSGPLDGTPMQAARLKALVAIAPFISAMSLDLGETAGADPRDSLDLYVHQLTNLLEMQIEELSEFLSNNEIEEFRQEQYDWRIQRDIHCMAVRRTDPRELRELDCLAEQTEERFQELERELAQREEALVRHLREQANLLEAERR